MVIAALIHSHMVDSTMEDDNWFAKKGSLKELPLLIACRRCHIVIESAELTMAIAFSWPSVRVSRIINMFCAGTFCWPCELTRRETAPGLLPTLFAMRLSWLLPFGFWKAPVMGFGTWECAGRASTFWFQTLTNFWHYRRAIHLEELRASKHGNAKSEAHLCF